MDVLLSLPIVSYLLGPGAATSWSTSVNVLFFYLTWTTLVMSYAPLHIELVGVLAIRVVLWLIPSLAFLAFDTSLPSLAANVKIGGAAALPPRTDADRSLLVRLTLLGVFNLAVEVLLQAGLQVALLPALSGVSSLLSTGMSTAFTTVHRLIVPKPKSSFFSLSSLSSLSSVSSNYFPAFPRTTKTPVLPPLFNTASKLPLPWQILKQTVVLFLLREVLVYYIHRFLLSRPDATSSSRLYPASLIRRLSRWHLGSYAHTRQQAPFSLLVFADHPTSVFFLRWVPLYGSALLVRPHLLVFLVFVGLVTLEETLGMSGYRVVPGLLLRGIARRTATHYTGAVEPERSEGRRTRSKSGKNNKTSADAELGVNFGAWGLLDWAQGTSWPRSGSLVADAQAGAVVVPGLGALQDAAATVSQVVAGEKKKAIAAADAVADPEDDADDDEEEEEPVTTKRGNGHSRRSRKKAHKE
ncbi:hypothetical protein Sste5346_006395 [Sporothrix stenoceras]|uniref:Fatty acid hydroxylase domain-containing protein n=1 Tax=Sporothrix stenoceras TaxID=5173 RepID=A0ABR3Z0H1_9PEZI